MTPPDPTTPFKPEDDAAFVEWAAAHMDYAADDKDKKIAERLIALARLGARQPDAGYRASMLRAAEIAEAVAEQVYVNPMEYDIFDVDGMIVRAILAEAEAAAQAPQPDAAPEPVTWSMETAPKDGTHILGLVEFPAEQPFVREWREIWFSHKTGLFGLPCWEAAQRQQYGTNVVKAWRQLPDATPPAPVPAGEVTEAMVDAFAKSYWPENTPYESERKEMRNALRAALAARGERS